MENEKGVSVSVDETILMDDQLGYVDDPAIVNLRNTIRGCASKSNLSALPDK